MASRLISKRWAMTATVVQPPSKGLPTYVTRIDFPKPAAYNYVVSYQVRFSYVAASVARHRFVPDLLYTNGTQSNVRRRWESKRLLCYYRRMEIPPSYYKIEEVANEGCETLGFEESVGKRTRR